MSEHTQTLVSALEYEALLNLDRIIRLAMVRPNVGEFLAGALQALDQVRRDQGLPIPEAPPEEQPKKRNLTLELVRGSLDRERSTGNE